MGCVAPDELAGFVAGTLTDERYDAVLAHVDECSACRAALGEQAAVASPPHPPMASTVAATGDTARGLPVGQANSAATPGNRIDRYIVMRVIGEGGMGVVTLARDPELRRKVVIKLVRPDILAGDDTNGVRTRLMVEAQAMARVSHPNVVPIYDVGTLRDQVFIAMEYIEGSNLAQWLEQTTRKHSEILAVFRAAGRGLAAAHEAKLVHRDFKPHNVLIGKSGVVKVTDFGLARAFEAAGHAGASTGLVATTDLVLDKLQLTRTGMLLGTPAYMSPEQITGDVVDHRTDQFSFCVALYHALYRVRPFSGTTMETLLDSIQRGQLAPSKERVDPAIRAAVVRGLSANPADRFPSMTDLIAELTPRRRRLPFALVGVGIAAVVGGFAVTKLVRGGGSSDEPAAPVVASTCETDPLAELWSPARRQSVLDLGKNVGKADLGTAIVKDVDGYVDAWRKMHRENCTSTRVEHEQPEAIMLRRDACLDQAHADLRRALDGVLLATDADRLQSSYDGVLRVRDLARCLEIGFGFALVPHEPGLLVKVNNVRIEIGRAGLLAAQLQFDEAEAHYAAQLQEARKLKYPPIEAEAQIGIGQLAMTRSRWQEAATAMTEAIQLADLGHHDDAKGKAQLALAEIMARLGKPDDADRYRRAALGSLHDAGSLAKAELDLARSLAKSLEVAGKVDEAIVQHDKAIAAAEKLYGEQPDLILVLSDKASLLQKVFRYQEALKLYERSRDLWIKRTTLAGPDGTLAKAGAAASRNQILMMLWNLGRNDEAIELGKSIIASKEDIGSTRTTLALAYADTHDEKQALEAVDASVVDASQDRKGIAYAMALLMRGVVLDRLGRHAEAEDQIRKAIAPVDSALPPDMRVVFTNALAITLVHQNKPEPAIEILTRNVATFDVWSGGDTSLLQGTIARLALAYAKGKKYDKAIETASRGLAFAGYKNPSDVGMLTFALARGTYQTDHARGLDLAKQARAAYEKINQQTRIAEIDAWIAKPE